MCRYLPREVLEMGLQFLRLYALIKFKIDLCERFFYNRKNIYQKNINKMSYLPFVNKNIVIRTTLLYKTHSLYINIFNDTISVRITQHILLNLHKLTLIGYRLK